MFIKLHIMTYLVEDPDREVYLNPSFICQIQVGEIRRATRGANNLMVTQPRESCTMVYLTGEETGYQIRETPEEILALIRELRP